MFKRKILGKKGGTIILIVMLLALLFPIIIMGMIDMTNMFRIQERLKTVLNASVKSASSRVDWERVPDGEFMIDAEESEQVFVDIFNSNIGAELKKEGKIYKCTSENTGTPIKVYFTIYNERHKGDYVNFPNAGEIPSEITNKHLYTSVDRPTVVAVSRVDYKTSPLLGGKTIGLIQLASSQLNIAPEVGETVESVIDENDIKGEELVSNPNLVDAYKDYTSSNSHYEVVETKDILNGYPVFRVQKKTNTASPIQIGTINIAAGEVYTASIWIKADNHSVLDYTSLLGFYRNSQVLSNTQVDRIGEWIRLQTTYVNNTGSTLSNVSVNYYPARASGSITHFAFPKIEKGSEATD